MGAVNRPVNVVTGWLDPDITLAQLSEAGAKRISVGGALSRLALATFVKAAQAMRQQGSFAWMRDMIGVAGAAGNCSRPELGVLDAAMIGELAWLAASVMVAGVVTGILAGLFGIGGGAVIVPVLFEVFRVLGVPDAVRMQLCIGTSMAIIVPTALRSYRAHKARGLVLPEVMRRWALPSVAGVVVGSALAAVAPPDVFKVAFVLIACLIAAKFLIGGDGLVLGNELPGRAAMTCYGFAIGLGSSLMGISGGSLVTMTSDALPHADPQPQWQPPRASACPITLAGTIGYVLAGLPHQALLPPLSLGFVSMIGVVLVAPLSSWVAPFGARLAHRLPKRKLEISVRPLSAARRLAFPGEPGDCRALRSTFQGFEEIDNRCRPDTSRLGMCKQRNAMRTAPVSRLW